MDLTQLPIITFSSDLQSEKAEFGICVIDFGITTSLSFSQYSKVEFSIVKTPSPIITFFNDLQ